MNASQNIPAGKDTPTIRQKPTQESTAIFQAMADHVDTAISITDPAGTIIYSNRVAYELLGYDYEKQELDGAPIHIFAPEQQRARQAELMAKIRSNGSKVVVDAVAVRKDGSTVHVTVTRFPIFNEQNQLTHIGTILRDITERKRAEEKIREGEERFQRFTEATLEGLVFHEEGRIIDANPTALAMFGLSDKSEMIGRTILEFIAPEFHEAVLHNMKLDNTYALEMECIRKDGSVFPVESITSSYREAGRLIRAGALRDITQRRQAERDLQREKSLSDAVINGMAGMFFLFDAQGKLFRWNDEYERVLGYNASELASRTALSSIAEEDQEKTRSAIERGFIEGQGSLEAVVITRDGRRIPYYFVAQRVELDGQMFVAGTGLDITERKQTERELQEKQQLLQLVMDNIPQSVFWKDKENLKYLGVNQAFADDAGFASSQEMIGKDDFEMPWKDQADLYRADDQRVLDTGEAKLNYEESQTGPTGQAIWLRTSKIPMRDTSGQVFAVLGMYEDITERKQLERQVENALEKRGYQVQVSREISQEVAAATELSDLFNRVVTLTKDRLGYYHTQLLRYDAHRDAVVLINGYGETGRKMLAGGHQLPMGEGLIGIAAATGETVMRSNLANDPDWRPNPLLPETKGEIAVPIKWQDNVLGVLDVQSNQAGALADDDRLLLEGLCGQIAIAVHSAQLLEAIRQNEARLAEALKIARLGNWEYDFENDLFHFTDSFYDIFRTSAEKVGGYAVSSADYSRHFVHPDDAPIVGAEIQKILEAKDRFSTTHLEHRIIYSDGELGYIAVNINVERDENGKIIRWYGANQDITERKRAEEALRQSEQEMAERLEELNHLYRNMSHEGWKAYRATAELPAGFMFDQTETRPVEEVALAEENIASVPMKVLGGEVVGTLAVASDPHNPIAREDIAFLEQVSDQIALALESARLTAQTQSALAQSERLFAASRILTQSADLQELTASVVEILGIPEINRALLSTFNYDADGKIESLDIVANWWNGTGREATAVGTHYPLSAIPAMSFFLNPTPVFFGDTHSDEHLDATTMKLAQDLNLRAVAILPLHTGARQTGALVLEAEVPHNFIEEEIRLFTGLAPQIATVLENRRQFEQAQRQARREATLNAINQKIQSATSVEAVLQIAARELGHALDASKAVAQLGVYKRNSGNGNHRNQLS